MTQVCFQADNNRYVLAMDGHATGDDTVCAAVSGMAYALAGYLINAEREGLVEELTVVMDSGMVRIACGGGQAVKVAFDLTAVGMRQVERQYPTLVAVACSTG